jgi:phosphotriesterase-related protein
MTDIQTVVGPIAHTQLGLTLSHEHLFVTSAGIRANYPWMFDPEREMAHAIVQLNEARAAGVQTLIDCSTPDLGREPAMMRAAAEATGMQIIVATGLWLDIPRLLHRPTIPIDDIAALFVHEIEEGLAGAPCRAGVIKVANGDPPGIGEPQEKVLRAAARAAMRTRVPITTHTGPYTIGREQMQIFADEGVPRELVAIGHSYTDDVAYLREVLERGHYLSVDRFRAGRDEEAGVIAAVARLCAEGHASHIMLGDDAGPEQWRWGAHPNDPSPTAWGHIPRDLPPALAQLGVSAADVDAMLVGAPATFLAGGRA